MSGTGKSSDGTSFLGWLWEKVKHYLWLFLRAESTISTISTIKGTHLMDLNDDCLREIISYLTVNDLCSVAESSTKSNIRLKDIATEVFRRSRKISHSNKVKVYEINESRRVFLNFRSVILGNVLTFTNLTSLRIHCCHQNVTQFIHDLNSLTLLTNLTLHRVLRDPEFIPAVANLKQLRYLVLRKCDLNDLNPLADLENLEFLHIVTPNSSDVVDFDIIQLVKRLRKLIYLCVLNDNIRLDKETYLRLVDVVRWEARGCLCVMCEVHEDVADVHYAGDNRYMVTLGGLPKIWR